MVSPPGMILKCAYWRCPAFDKLVFDGVYRRAGARPRRWVPVLNGCHSTQISKIDTFRRGRAPALRYERPFSVQPTDRKLAAGRRGHDPALRIVITSNSNLSGCWGKPIYTFFKYIPEGDTLSYISYPISHILPRGGAPQEARVTSSVWSRKVLRLTPSIWLDRAQ